MPWRQNIWLASPNIVDNGATANPIHLPPIQGALPTQMSFDRRLKQPKILYICLLYQRTVFMS